MLLQTKVESDSEKPGQDRKMDQPFDGSSTVGGKKTKQEKVLQ